MTGSGEAGKSASGDSSRQQSAPQDRRTYLDGRVWAEYPREAAE